VIVYLIRNRINSKVYVGKTSQSLERRWQQHVWTARSKKIFNWPLHNAIRKYGADAFAIEPICEATTLTELNTLERFHIAQYCGTDPKIGYNRTTGGDGVAGIFKFRLSKRELGAAIRLGLSVQDIADLEHVSRITVTLSVKRHYSKTFFALRKSWGLPKLGREKISAALKGKPFTAVHRQRCVEHLAHVRANRSLRFFKRTHQTSG
jgi:group I intron endonuclease